MIDVTQLIDDGEYFSEDAIKHRQPALYQMYIGRYLRNGSQVPTNFYELLLKQAQSEEATQKLEDVLARFPSWKKHLDEVNKELTPEEQSDNEDELLTLCHQIFLAGLDTNHIEYSLIDDNE